MHLDRSRSKARPGNQERVRILAPDLVTERIATVSSSVTPQSVSWRSHRSIKPLVAATLLLYPAKFT